MAVFGLSSTLSFAICSLSPFSDAISSSTGAIILHGPHHSAQKSTSTGFSDPLIVSSKVESLSATMCSDTPVPFGHRHGVRRTSLRGCEHRPRVTHSSRASSARVGPGRQPPLGLHRRHAATAGGGDGLAEHVVLDVP